MNTVLLETKQDYIDYCVENDVLNIPRKYASQYTEIDGGIDHDLYDVISIDGKYISSEPLAYPCIFVWTCIDGNNDIYRGEFIYPGDFELMKKYKHE